jgi:predicted Rossmann-fold nucleotide-binding protein
MKKMLFLCSTLVFMGAACAKRKFVGSVSSTRQSFPGYEKLSQYGQELTKLYYIQDRIAANKRLGEKNGSGTVLSIAISSQLTQETMAALLKTHTASDRLIVYLADSPLGEFLSKNCKTKCLGISSKGDAENVFKFTDGFLLLEGLFPEGKEVFSVVDNSLHGLAAVIDDRANVIFDPNNATWDFDLDGAISAQTTKLGKRADRKIDFEAHSETLLLEALKKLDVYTAEKIKPFTPPQYARYGEWPNYAAQGPYARQSMPPTREQRFGLDPVGSKGGRERIDPTRPSQGQKQRQVADARPSSDAGSNPIKSIFGELGKFLMGDSSPVAQGSPLVKAAEEKESLEPDLSNLDQMPPEPARVSSVGPDEPRNYWTRTDTQASPKKRLDDWVAQGDLSFQAYEKSEFSRFENVSDREGVLKKALEAQEKFGIDKSAVFFGSGSLPYSNDFLTQPVTAFASGLVGLGFSIAHGGAGGVMDIARRATLAAGGNSISIPIGAGNFRVEGESFFGGGFGMPKSSTKDVTVSAFDYRDRIPALLAKKQVVVVCPGGNGTMKEIAATLLHSIANPEMIVVFLNTNANFYTSLYYWFKAQKYSEKVNLILAKSFASLSQNK